MTEATTARPTLRERQRRETHRLIHRTAYDLALASGVSAVSVHSISEAAGISPRTFFNHFRSKDEALVPDLPDFTAEAQEAFLAEDAADLLTALQVLLSGHLAVLHEQAGAGEGPAAMKRLLEANPELLPRVLAVFEAFEQRVAALVARRTGRAPEDLFCTVAALTATATVRAAFNARCEAGADPTRPLSVQVPAAFAVLRRVVSPERTPSA